MRKQKRKKLIASSLHSFVTEINCDILEFAGEGEKERNCTVCEIRFISKCLVRVAFIISSNIHRQPICKQLPRDE